MVQSALMKEEMKIEIEVTARKGCGGKGDEEPVA